MKLVLVDIDGTLLRGRSEVRFMVHLAARRRIGALALLRSCAFVLANAVRYGRHVWKKNKTYLAGLESLEVERLGSAFVRERLASKIRGEMLARISEHRAQGDRVLLLSGTPSFIAEPLAQAIGAHGAIATCCAARDGRFLAEAPSQHPFAADKLSLAKTAAAEMGLSLDECVAYGDSMHDRDLLRAVGRAIAVVPDRKLRALANLGGWEVIEEKPRRRRARTRQRRLSPT